eukprot:Sspe_Gene.84137::Locus_55228_Transcript_1_1_Confidence_1.000_Length_3050::g.84137::m.84137
MMHHAVRWLVAGVGRRSGLSLLGARAASEKAYWIEDSIDEKRRSARVLRPDPDGSWYKESYVPVGNGRWEVRYLLNGDQDSPVPSPPFDVTSLDDKWALTINGVECRNPRFRLIRDYADGQEYYYFADPSLRHLGSFWSPSSAETAYLDQYPQTSDDDMDLPIVDIVDEESKGGDARFAFDSIDVPRSTEPTEAVDDSVPDSRIKVAYDEHHRKYYYCEARGVVKTFWEVDEAVAFLRSADEPSEPIATPEEPVDTQPAAEAQPADDTQPVAEGTTQPEPSSSTVATDKEPSEDALDIDLDVSLAEEGAAPLAATTEGTEGREDGGRKDSADYDQQLARMLVQDFSGTAGGHEEPAVEEEKRYRELDRLELTALPERPVLSISEGTKFTIPLDDVIPVPKANQELVNLATSPSPVTSLVLRVASGTNSVSVEDMLRSLRGSLLSSVALQLDLDARQESDSGKKEALYSKALALREEAAVAASVLQRKISGSPSDSEREMLPVLALPFNPLHGIPLLFIPSMARRALHRHVINIVTLRRLLDSSVTFNSILNGGLPEVVLSASQRYRRVLQDGKTMGKWQLESYKAEKRAAYNLLYYAGAAHNGHLFWSTLQPTASDGRGELGRPGTSLIDRALQKCYGGFENFCDEIILHAQGVMGSGWVWLVHHPTKFERRGDVRRFSASPSTEASTEDTPLLAASTETTTAVGSEEAEGLKEPPEDAVVLAQTSGQKDVVSSEDLPVDDQILNRIVVDDSQECCIRIVTTSGNESPLTFGLNPIMGIEVTDSAYIFDETTVSDEEAREAKKWGIRNNDLQGYIRRYLQSVDWRKVEYQLRMCFPEELAGEGGLEAASDCLRMNANEELHTMWLDIPKTSSEETDADTAVAACQRMKGMIDKLNYGKVEWAHFLYDSEFKKAMEVALSRPAPEPLPIVEDTRPDVATRTQPQYNDRRGRGHRGRNDYGSGSRKRGDGDRPYRRRENM